MTSPNIESGEDLFQALIELKGSPILNEFDWLDLVADALDDKEIPTSWRTVARRLIEGTLGQPIEDSLVR